MKYTVTCVAKGKHPDKNSPWAKTVWLDENTDWPSHWDGNYNSFISAQDMHAKSLFTDLVDKEIQSKKGKLWGPITATYKDYFEETCNKFLSASPYQYLVSYVTLQNNYINFDFRFAQKKYIGLERPYETFYLNIHFQPRKNFTHEHQNVIYSDKLEAQDIIDLSKQVLSEFIEKLLSGKAETELNKITEVYNSKNPKQRFDIGKETTVGMTKQITSSPTSILTSVPTSAPEAKEGKMESQPLKDNAKPGKTASDSAKLKYVPPHRRKNLESQPATTSTNSSSSKLPSEDKKMQTDKSASNKSGPEFEKKQKHPESFSLWKGKANFQPQKDDENDLGTSPVFTTEKTPD